VIDQPGETVTLPGKESDTVEIMKFTGLKKRFKPSQSADKEAFLLDARKKVTERLVSVDIEQLTDKDWIALGVPISLGRSVPH
jgi:hypothetical protein